MGRATRWLKGLFGLKTKETSNSGDRHNVDKSGRDSSGLCHNPTTIPPNIIPAEAAWLRSCYNETEKEQRKQAIAVAAATAAAADAAVAAVHAAVAVVRLTSHGRVTILEGGRAQWAAVKIQTVFRGYLARKALCALKGLVKLQAHVRGYLVRKQATATLHSMQALIRAQATVLSHRICSQNEKSMERSDDARTEHTFSIHNRRLWGSFDNFMSNFDENPKIVEVYTGRPNPRSRRTNISVSEFSVDPPYQTYSSPVSSRGPARLAIPDWGLTGDECRFSTARSTRSPSPRFVNSVGSNTPGTPAESMCADNPRQSLNFPNYMANTQSSKAKLRCHSAPKQRPDPAGSKKRLSLNEMMEGRNRLSGAKMQRSCSQVQEAISIKNAVMGKLTRSSELRRELEKHLG